MAYKVLIVEDTRELAEIIQLVLSRHDILTTFIEADGQTAIRRFQEIEPDLILLDINLPDMRGWHVLDEIRRIAEADNDLQMPKIIITSAYTDAASRVTGKLQDIVKYLIKPFKPSQVEAAVLEALGLADNDH